MSALARMKAGLRYANFSFGPMMGYGVIGELAETAVGAGASYAIGQIHGRYRDHEHIQNMPIAIGVLGKLVALIASAFSYGRRSMVGGFADAVGQAGVNAHFMSMGIAHGFEASGRKLITLPPGAEMPKGLPATATRRTTILGDIPPAAPGRYLSRDAIRDLARHV